MFPASLRNENTMEIRGRLGMDTRYSSRKQRLPHFLMRSGPLDPIRPDPRRPGSGGPRMTRQSDNVPFEQSRNVPLTAPSFGDARRTTTDDTSRPRPAGDADESQEEVDYAARGSRGTGAEHSAGEAPTVCLEEAGRPGGGPRAARSSVQPEDRGQNRKAGGQDIVGAGVRRVRADLGGGVPGEETRNRGEQRDGAAMDDSRQAVARQEREGQAGALLAAAAKPLGGTGAMGHQRTRLAGRAGREALSDRHDRRCHQPIIRAVRAA